MFEYFYDVFYAIYQFLIFHQNKEYYFCELFSMLSQERDWP